MKKKLVLVTGGAGFVGSHLVERLFGSNEVTVIDGCSSGQAAWVADDAALIQPYLCDRSVISDFFSPEFDIVFHLAASKAVDSDRPREQFELNTQISYNVLEPVGKNGVNEPVCTCSSAVYGEAPRPTPGDHAPLKPISPYGSSKLADGGLCSAYTHSHRLTIYSLRFASIVGRRLRDAIIPGFIEKLKHDPDSIEILVNGRQEKSNLYISDCIDIMLTTIERAHEPVNVYNLGTRTTSSVNSIGDIVSNELKLEPNYECTGSDREWASDVTKIRLSINKTLALGWSASYSSEQAIRMAAREPIEEFE